MYNVNTGYIHNDQILTNLSVKYANNEYVGKMLMPDLTVAKETGKYRIFSRDGFFKGVEKKSDGALTPEAGLSYDEGTYTCYERAVKDIVTDRAIQQADTPVNPLMDTTEFLTEKIMLSEELDIWILATSTSGLNQSGYRTVLTGTTAWSGGTNPDILGDFSTAIKTIAKATARRPNFMFFNTDVAEAVAQDDSVKEIIKYHTMSTLMGSGLPETIRSMRVVITDALYNTSDDGATASYDYVISDNTICAYVDTRNPLTFGRNLVSRNMRVSRWRDEEREGQFIQVSKVYSPKITTLASGYIFTNCVA